VKFTECIIFDCLKGATKNPHLQLANFHPGQFISAQNIVFIMTSKGIFVDPNDVYAAYDKAFAVDPKMKKITDKIRKTRAFEPPPQVEVDQYAIVEFDFPEDADYQKPLDFEEVMSLQQSDASDATFTSGSTDTFSNIYSDPYDVYSNPYSETRSENFTVEGQNGAPVLTTAAVQKAQSDKKIKSIILWILLILVLVGIGYFLYRMSKGQSCKSSSTPSMSSVPVTSNVPTMSNILTENGGIKIEQPTFGYYANLRQPVNAFRQPKH
jgi:hypothetical protein